VGPAVERTNAASLCPPERTAVPCTDARADARADPEAITSTYSRSHAGAIVAASPGPDHGAHTATISRPEARTVSKTDDSSYTRARSRTVVIAHGVAHAGAFTCPHATPIKLPYPQTNSAPERGTH